MEEGGREGVGVAAGRAGCEPAKTRCAQAAALLPPQPDSRSTAVRAGDPRTAIDRNTHRGQWD